MIGIPVEAHAEEVADLVAPGEESTIKWYIGQDGFDRIAAGLVCGNCLEPFPAPPNLKHAKAWRDNAHHYARLRTPDELMTLIAKGVCPVCQTEVSNDMTAATHKGVDPFAPQALEIPE